jgi:MoaA/NifB/PqqE/SkfB family radical SAM enzyme
MKLLGQYQNGNYKVQIFNDGTKIRETDDDQFISAFPECIDLKITNQCDLQCPYCHEDSTPFGNHGDLNAEFIDTLHPFTELAIGGGNPLIHPQLIPFLEKLRNKHIIANITVNQRHFMNSQDIVKYLVSHDLIKGLGISLTNVDEKFIELIKQYQNAVIHVINGVVKLEDLQKLYNHNLKVLILGYKEIRRGKDYHSFDVEKNKQIIYENICDIVNGFKVASFDNLAIKQLDLKRIFSDKDWNEFFMGDDGEYTMYIDAVKQEFAKSSTSLERFKLLPSIEEMFEVVKNNA